MLKKIIAVIASTSILATSLIPSFTYAVATNSAASPWTMEKAEHLARKAYFAATPDIITSLYQAGSASAAANVVFPSINGPDRTQFETEISNLTSSGFNWGDGSNMNRLYQYRYARNPYESKAKLFSLFEDIFPVNQSDKISYKDIIDQHDLLYSYTLGNYRDMIKRNLYNNGGRGDYAMGKFLDLLDQQNKNSPNENYGRELIQLFLMGEYLPGESKENGNARNYEESDVASVAKILTGYMSDALTHQVSYSPSAHNTSSGVVFLSGALKSGVSFPFMNGSGALDLSLMANPIGGNNGIGDNTIDYIFAMREQAVSLFLADRMYRFYIHGAPTRSELDVFAAQIVANNFELLPSVKWLLASDYMYSDMAMNSVTYKNPLELSIGTIKLLHAQSPNVIDSMLRDSSLLSRFNWTPYFPGSVFGRDGFDDNQKFYSSYIQNQWISYTSRIAFDTQSGSYLMSELVQTTNRLIDSVTSVATSTGNTFTGALVVQSGNFEYTAQGSQTGQTLSISTGSFSIPNLTLATVSGSLTLRSASYNPVNLVLTITDGQIGQGTGALLVNSGSIQFAPGSNLIREITPAELFTMLEGKLLLGRVLPDEVKTKMTQYLTTNNDGTPGLFRPSNTSFQNIKIRSIISMFLAQPEFVIQTGYDRPPTVENLAQSVLNNPNGKLLFVELGGGYDWLHGIVPKNEYNDYVSSRTITGGTIALGLNRETDLGDFYMNNALAYGSGGTTPSLKSLFDSNNLRIFNRVGTPNHSRDHDQAQKQIASYGATTLDDADGVFGQLIRYEPNSENTISLSGRRPNVFRNGRYINIGPSGAIFSNNYLGQLDRNAQLNTLRSTLQTRSYPDRTADLFKSSVRVDEIAQASKLGGGPDGAGYGNTNNLKFLRTLLTNNVGKAFYMQADGGYDTHSNQLAPQSNFDSANVPKDLNYNIGGVMSNLTKFFNDVKDTQNITIVVFSEFGRTTKVNGDLGTDHGEGGGMFVISNNPTLLTSLDKKVYGNISVTKAKNNWLGVGIDYRSVYGKIYNALYGVSDSAHFGSTNELAKDVSLDPVKAALTRYEYRSNNDNNVRLSVKMKFEGNNFDSRKSGYVDASRLKDQNNVNSEMSKINTWEIDNYARKPNNVYDFSRDWIGEKRTYKLSYQVYSNQYTETLQNFTIPVPDVVPSNVTPVVTGTGNLVFRRYDNTSVSQIGTPLSGSGVILANITGTGGGITLTSAQGVTITTGTGLTAVTSVMTQSGASVWNGGFVLGDLIDPAQFVSKDAKITNDGMLLTDMNIEQIAKVGADTLGVGMSLNQPVTLSIPATPNKVYRVITSEDGLNWNTVGDNSSVSSGTNGKVTFSTQNFSYFALVLPTPIIPPSCTISASSTAVTNGTPVILNWSSQNAVSATLSPVGSQLLQGSLNVTPPADTGTAYVLTVTNNRSTTATCQVIVTATGFTPPVSGGGGSSISSSGGGSGGNSNAGAPLAGNGGFSAGNVFTKDMCPNGDTSGNNFDGRCVSVLVSVTNPSSTATTLTTTPPSTVITTTPPPVVNPTPTIPTKKPVRVKKPISNKAPLPPQVTPLPPSVKKPVVPKSPTVIQRPLRPPVSVQKPNPTPIMSQPRPVATPTPATTAPYDVSKKLDYLMAYTGPDFDNYNWSDDRRFPSTIYLKIDAKVSSLDTELKSERTQLQGRLALLQNEITKRISTATTERDIRILKYLKNEITILQELNRRPH